MEFLVDNIYVRFGGQLFRQMVGIPMKTNCAPLLAELFLYSYENVFLDKLIKEDKRKLARKFNLSYHYIDELISFNSFSTRIGFLNDPLCDEYDPMQWVSVSRKVISHFLKNRVSTTKYLFSCLQHKNI